MSRTNRYCIIAFGKRGDCMCKDNGEYEEELQKLTNLFRENLVTKEDIVALKELLEIIVRTKEDEKKK